MKHERGIFMNLIYKLFIKDYKNIENPDVKSAYGKVSSIMGILLNIFLLVRGDYI